MFQQNAIITETLCMQSSNSIMQLRKSLLVQ